MSGLLAAQTSVYEFPLAAINQLIANDMNVPLDCIKVEYVVSDIADDRMDRYSHYACTKVKVTVDQMKLVQLKGK